MVQAVKTGCPCKGKSPGQQVFQQRILKKCETFLRSSTNSTVRSSREIGIPQSTSF